MHEISLLDNVRDILQSQAKIQNFSRIKQVTLDIGALSCVETDAMRFAFDVVMKDSVAEDAELVITVTKGVGICQKCHKRVELVTLHDPCGVCGHPFVEVIQGSEMKIKDLLVV